MYLRSLVCAIINSVCAALMDAGVMTTDMITSCSAGELFSEGRKENKGGREKEVREVLFWESLR